MRYENKEQMTNKAFKLCYLRMSYRYTFETEETAYYLMLHTFWDYFLDK